MGVPDEVHVNWRDPKDLRSLLSELKEKVIPADHFLQAAVPFIRMIPSVPSSKDAQRPTAAIETIKTQNALGAVSGNALRIALLGTSWFIIRIEHVHDCN